MIDTVAIRNRLIEMAIRGELSEREGNIGDIDLLIKQIKCAREILIKNKETKISKTAEMISEDLFEIPQGWKWVALGDLCIMLSRGKSPTYSEEKKYPVFAQKCNQPDHLALDKALFLDETTLSKWPNYFRLRDTDVVINSTGTGTVGRIGYYLTETLYDGYPFMLPDSHVTLVRVGEGIISKYIYYALRSSSIQTIIEKQLRGSTNQKEFYIDSVYATPIPLPSTEEQIRIVEKLDGIHEALTIIDILQSQYASNLEVLKNKLIDAGISGKLTKQLPEDGSAEDLYAEIQAEKAKLIKEGKLKKEKPFEDITKDEIPFEIPANWKWVSIGDVCSNIMYGTSKKSQKDGKIPVIRMGNLQGGHIRYDDLVYSSDEEEIACYRLEYNDLLFNRTNSWELVGKTAIYKAEIPAIFAGYLIRFRPVHLNADYLNYVMQSGYYWEYCNQVKIGAVNQANINSEKLKAFTFPLPPVNEQKRIVDRLESLFKQMEEYGERV